MTEVIVVKAQPFDHSVLFNSISESADNIAIPCPDPVEKLCQDGKENLAWYKVLNMTRMLTQTSILQNYSTLVLNSCPKAPKGCTCSWWVESGVLLLFQQRSLSNCLSFISEFQSHSKRVWEKSVGVPCLQSRRGHLYVCVYVGAQWDSSQHFCIQETKDQRQVGCGLMTALSILSAFYLFDLSFAETSSKMAAGSTNMETLGSIVYQTNNQKQHQK